MSRSKRHTHKYYRQQLEMNTFVWACGLGDCNHHMPKHYERMLLGKYFYCWECGEIDILRDEHLKLNPEYFMSEDKLPSRPRCINCVQGNQNIDDNDINTILERLGKNDRTN